MVRFAAPNGLLAALRDFPAGRLGDRHLGNQVVGKPSEMRFPTPGGRIGGGNANRIKPLAPGLHVYWPLTTEVEVIVTARQTLTIPEQVLATKDGKKVVVKTLVVYKIRDVEHAIGRVNWDVDSTINDLTQSAVVRVVATHTYDEIMKGLADETLITTLTREVRKELRQFGVHVVRSKLVDFAECKVFKLMTSQADRAGMTHSQFCL